MEEKVKKERISYRCEAINKGNNDVLYLYGTIAESSYFEDTINASYVKNELNKVQSESLDVHINSNGGDVFQSIAIYNLLKQFKGNVNIYIDGLAASGASIIAMAGQTIFMPKNTMMMVHKAWTFAYGNSDELRKTAEDLEKIDLSVTESYKARFVGEDSELIELISKETWLTADECLVFGFCDEIIGDETKSNTEETKVKLFAKYNKEAKEPEPAKSLFKNKIKGDRK